MTAPEPTAVERTIAEVDEAHTISPWVDQDGERRCSCGQWTHSAGLRHRPTPAQHRAQAVVAAIRNLPPADIAELMPDLVSTAAAGALHAAASDLASNAAEAWGGNSSWLTTGRHVAGLAADWVRARAERLADDEAQP